MVSERTSLHLYLCFSLCLVVYCIGILWGRRAIRPHSEQRQTRRVGGYFFLSTNFMCSLLHTRKRYVLFSGASHQLFAQETPHERLNVCVVLSEKAVNFVEYVPRLYFQTFEKFLIIIIRGKV